MTDAFAELVMPIFRKVIDLQGRLARGESRTLDEVKRMTSEWLEEARRRALGNPALKRSYDLALFGLLAWIDEVLTESEWGRNVGSPEEILEWVFFASRDRATLFYDHAERAEEERDLDAMETYLLAVTLGFRGKLRRDDAGLADWVNRVHGRIRDAGTVPDRPFAKDPLLTEHFGPLRGPSLLLRASILASVTALITLAAYLCAVHVEYDSQSPGSTAETVSAGRPAE
jgi:type VI protein secretion system component VasF